MIKRKKLADQVVLEEQSKALAAKQKQYTMIVEENNRSRVELEIFSGTMQQKIIQAKAEGIRIRREADAYYARKNIGAEALFYQLEKQAEAILVQKTADAQGIEKLKTALEGEGGRNMVKLEYARRLKDIKISAKPYTIKGTIERFDHSTGAISVGRE